MTELVIWRYANAFIFTNQSAVDFWIALVLVVVVVVVVVVVANKES
jgi:hypothetical protein